MSLRQEFQAFARQPGANISALCRHYGISRKTAYKWLGRQESDYQDRSRRPLRSPAKTCAQVEKKILRARDRHPAWGARKLKRFLEDRGETDLPAVSTITAILHRHRRIAAAASEAAERWQRFEHSEPNSLWQMDFKGHFAMTQGRCHPLTVLDDHSRFNLVLQACSGETFSDAQKPLIACFKAYGLPVAICCDNGAPWGTPHREDRLTSLGVWLIQLGIRLIHARPRHPQTNGKDERFHRTLNCELLRYHVFTCLRHAQSAFDVFRGEYNLIRPHDAIGLSVPASRYRPSDRPFPDRLPAIEYDPALQVRKVDISGKFFFQGKRYRASRALIKHHIALKPDPENDGLYIVQFAHQPIRTIDLRTPDQSD